MYFREIGKKGSDVLKSTTLRILVDKISAPYLGKYNPHNAVLGFGEQILLKDLFPITAL